MKLYRIEKNAEDGCWYNRNGEYSCEEPVLINHPMPREPHIYKNIYKSACSTLKDLFWWVKKEIAIRNGYVLAVYETDDYFYREHGEICFNKLTAIRTELSFSELKGEQQ